MTKQQLVQSLKDQVTTLTGRRDQQREAIAQEHAKGGKEDTPERTRLLTRLDPLTKERHQLTAQLVQCQDADPEVIAAKRRAADAARDAANRWTDNLFTLQTHLSRRFNITASAFAQQFGVPDDLDYLT